ncbi:hypothetical protein H0194_06240 [Corynebacterium incognita]|uniref:Uncharacterized protein n=1 Tax=Corynebacterium incognita TaxID=2754725 RepID=A0A7G7CM93_9CORY|nr:hypothetical protein [Corynebacterium incognita]QNE88709.1 hypothetical protein H0194_06240 [Corynebacterium incognita]
MTAHNSTNSMNSNGAADSAVAPEDNYALDDTMAGRAVQALTLGALYAVPDFAKSTLARVVGFGGVIVAGITAIGVANARRDDRDEDENLEEVREPAEVAAEGPAEKSAADDAGNHVKQWFDNASTAQIYGVLGGVLGLFGLSLWWDKVCVSWMARKLRKKGVRKPFSLIGAAVALIVFISSECDARAKGAE